MFTDKTSGAKDERQGLEDVFRFVRPSDTLVVWRLVRLGRYGQEFLGFINTTYT
ncbi:recombinase family protein [Brevibacillus porteri]|uniref:recombinase family protein n=1 Tax=Brevibacillus porteri TaxID=2126350 RepID=UPI00370CBA54